MRIIEKTDGKLFASYDGVNALSTYKISFFPLSLDFAAGPSRCS